MILDSISTTLDILNKSADFVKKVQEIGMNFTLPDEVKKINAKLDQDITRKIKSGYESLGFALRRSPGSSKKEQDLEDARNDLRDCVHLSDKLTTDGVPNEDMMAIANYGLALVYNLKRDGDKAAHYLLQAFQAGPRKARELAPEIYDQLFQSKCGVLATKVDPYPLSLAANAGSLIPGTGIRPQPSSNNNDELIRTATDVGKGLLQGVIFLGGAALAIASLGRVNPGMFIHGAGDLNKEVGKIPTDFVIQERERKKFEQAQEESRRLQQVRINKQDDCCRQTAAEYLAQLEFN